MNSMNLLRILATNEKSTLRVTHNVRFKETTEELN